MTKPIFVVLSLFFLGFHGFSQNDTLKAKEVLRTLPVVQDGDYYREDQLYFNVYSGNVLNQGDLVRRDGFSYGFAIGGYRDIPLNKRGSLALAIGLGYEFNRLQINFAEPSLSYNDIDPTELIEGITNKHSSIQVPIEFRWRNSTATKYKFWRIYTGFTFSWEFANTLKYQTNLDSYTQKSTDIINSWNIGPHINVGYSFWNFYCYYGLSEYFNPEGSLSGYTGVHSLKLGFQVYIF